MRAIVYRENGPADVLRLVERTIPEPGHGEVRVRVHVSGVNPTDWKSRAGTTGQVAGDVVPNQDGAGVIDAVGPGVDSFAPGDRVWLLLSSFHGGNGTAQDYTVVPASCAVHLPDAVSFDVGASLGVPAVTAHRALTVAEDGPRRLFPGALSGQSVLVAGGAGAVGHAAIQLARWAGADRVIATVSTPEKSRLARAAGADATVEYRAHDAAEQIRALAPEGIDIVVEVAPAQNAALNARVLANGATVAVYGAEGGREVQLDVIDHFTRNIRYQFLLLYTLEPALIRAATEDITAALESLALPVGTGAGLPLTRFPLTRTAEAHRAVEASVVGKVLIDLAD